MSEIQFTIQDYTSGSLVSTVIDEPVGLDKVRLHIRRDSDYHGFTDMIDDSLGRLQFYGPAFAILQAAYQDIGISAHVECMIGFQCADDGGFETMYQGRFNFSTYKQYEGLNGCYVEITIANGYWYDIFRNRLEQKVSLDSLQCFDEFQDDGVTPYPALTPYSALGINVELQPMLIRMLNRGTVDTPVVGSNVFACDNDGLCAGSFPGLQPTPGVNPGNNVTFYDTSQGRPFTDSPDQNEFNLQLSAIEIGGAGAVDQTGGAVINPFCNIAAAEVVGQFPGPVGEEYQGTSFSPGYDGGGALQNAVPIFTFQPDITYESNAVQIDIELSWAVFAGSPDGVDVDGLQVEFILCKGQNFMDAKNGRSFFANTDGTPGGTSGSTIGSPRLSSLGGCTINWVEYGGISLKNHVYDSVGPFVNAFNQQYAFHGKVWMNPGDQLFFLVNLQFINSGAVTPSDLQFVFFSDTYTFRNSYFSNKEYGNNGTATPSGGTVFTLTTQVNSAITSEGDTTPDSSTGHDMSFINVNGQFSESPIPSYADNNAQSYINLTFDSKFPANQAPTYLVNEALSRVAEIITDGNFRAISTYFGRTDSQPYPATADGPAGLLAIVNGLIMRGYSPLQAYRMGYTSFGLFSVPETTSAYTLNLTDEPSSGTPFIVRVTNPAGTTITIPLNASVNYPIGYQLIVEQGTGVATIAGATGVTLYAPSGGYATTGVGTMLLLTKVGTDIWLLASRSSMFLSFKDLINALNSVYTAGLALEPDTTRGGSYQRIRVEPIDYFYNSALTMLTCENVDNVETGTDAENTISEFSIGYSKWEAEEARGLDEFLTKRKYRTTLTSLRSKWNKLCEFIASGYAIEMTRRRLGTNTTDWRYDKDNFLISSQRSGATRAVAGTPTIVGGVITAIPVANGGGPYTSPPNITIIGNGGVGSGAVAVANMSDGLGGSVASITIPFIAGGGGGSGYTAGVTIIIDAPPSLQSEQGGWTTTPAPSSMIGPSSVYNARISPARNALRWLKWVIASYVNTATGQLIFQEGDGNYYASGELATNPIESGPLSENQTLVMSDYAGTVNPVVKNEIVTFSYPMGYADWASIYSNPYGLVAYNVNGGALRYGYLMELNYDLFTGMAEFTLKSKAA